MALRGTGPKRTGSRLLFGPVFLLELSFIGFINQIMQLSQTNGVMSSPGTNLFEIEIIDV
jgi:hypothetical protein